MSRMQFVAWALCAFSVVLPARSQQRIPIEHLVIIMQENRSFDEYFGTYRGADGFPKGTCVPLNPANPTGGCIQPFHNQLDMNAGGPHGGSNAFADLDNGVTQALQDGYVYQQTIGPVTHCKPPTNNPGCAAILDGIALHDVMGYHDADDLPNYWSYAKHFVLQDRMFEGVRDWSLSSHLELASEWVARCSNYSDASTCHTWPFTVIPTATNNVQYPWANLFQLLDMHKVSWKYYVGTGTEPDCEDDEMTCGPQIQAAGSASIWNAPPLFKWVKERGAAYLAAHNPRLEQFVVDAGTGRLPQVAWIVPSDSFSEHPPSGITAGMEYVTSLVNAVMTSPDWNSTAIFIVWDDWGGFYDHVVPPIVDRNGAAVEVQGYGLRVPGLMISPYARAGLIDHSLLSFDAFATFFEDLFMGGARLKPAALGNPDSRPSIRDALTSATFIDGHSEPVGKLINEFDFNQRPLLPLLLSTHIPTGITTRCNPNYTSDCTKRVVTIIWNPVAAGGVPGPFTYHVQRDGKELRQCMGEATKCRDAPGTGTHYYRAYSVDAKGNESPLSAAAKAIVH